MVRASAGVCGEVHGHGSDSCHWLNTLDYLVVVVAGAMTPQGLGPYGESVGLCYEKFLAYQKKNAIED